MYYSAALDDNWTEADKLGKWFAPFFSLCFIETNPIPIKTAMAKEGWCTESFRLPLCTLENEEHRQKLYERIDEMSADIKEGRI